MSTNKDEKEFYRQVCLLAFGNEPEYYFEKSTDEILDCLKKDFWGDNLMLRTRLMAKILHNEALINPKHRVTLKLKSQELSDHITHMQE